MLHVHYTSKKLGTVYEYLLELEAPGQNLFLGVTIKPGIMEQLKIGKTPLRGKGSMFMLISGPLLMDISRNRHF